MKFQRQVAGEVSVNLTPLIDVVFLLLIFFMVSTTFTRETQLTIDLPEATGEPRAEVSEHIEVLIDEAGNYRVDGNPLMDSRVRTLQAAVFERSGGNTELPLVITADAQARHQDVVRAMDAVGQIGFVHLTITTRQPASESE